MNLLGRSTRGRDSVNEASLRIVNGLSIRRPRHRHLKPGRPIYRLNACDTSSIQGSRAEDPSRFLVQGKDNLVGAEPGKRRAALKLRFQKRSHFFAWFKDQEPVFPSGRAYQKSVPPQGQCAGHAEGGRKRNVFDWAGAATQNLGGSLR